MKAKNIIRVVTNPTAAVAAIRAHEIKRLRMMREEIRASFRVRVSGTTVYFLAGGHLIETSSTWKSVSEIQLRLNELVEAEYQMKIHRAALRRKSEIEISFAL